ncbi:hypothetical protein J6590_050772 [Homalodisca vitripennis]|nr:hypothetical protein J6590_050772 [Homalodisca vitripennis]
MGTHGDLRGIFLISPEAQGGTMKSSTDFMGHFRSESVGKLKSFIEILTVPLAVVPPPAATPGKPAAVSQRSPRLQLVSYAEAARVSTTHDRDCPKEGSPLSKNCSGQTCVKPT